MEDLPSPPRGPWRHRTVDVDGPLHVLDFGGPPEGPTTLLVHGLDGSAANWVDLAPLLVEAGHRVAAVDLPGFGRSPLLGRDLSLPAVGDLVVRTAVALGWDTAQLVGNSWGGPVCLWAAAGAPDVTQGCVLLAPALPRRGSGLVDLAFASRFVLPYAVPGLMRAEPARRNAQPPGRRVRALLDLCYAAGSRESDLAFAEMVDVASARERDDHVDAWVAASRSLFRWMARPGAFHALAARVATSVLVVEGERDPIIPTTSIEAALERHPQWRHATVRGGHVPPLEAPAACTDLVASAHRAVGGRPR